MGFDSSEVAGACVADIIKAGVLPVAIEFMDRPCIRATEAFAKAGYPDVEALLIVEVEGSEAEIASSSPDRRRSQCAQPGRAARKRPRPNSCCHLEGPQIRLRRDGPDQRLHLP
jgi:FAD/FMN-containing dehydrogenase